MSSEIENYIGVTRRNMRRIAQALAMYNVFKAARYPVHARTAAMRGVADAMSLSSYERAGLAERIRVERMAPERRYLGSRCYPTYPVHYGEV